VNRSEIEEKATLIWKPNNNLSENQLDTFLNEAVNEGRFTIEQALLLLNWHRHDLKRAFIDLKKYEPKPDEWTHEDKILFEQAFCFNGKNFNKIRQVVSQVTHLTRDKRFQNELLF
jgi:hypothetical protein